MLRKCKTVTGRLAVIGWTLLIKPQILCSASIGWLAVGVWSGYWVQNLRYFAQKVQDRYRHAGGQCMERVLGTKPRILSTESVGRQAVSGCTLGTKPQIPTTAQKVQDKHR